MKNDINVIILAAGKGTRLRPVTNTIPKCMIPFLGKPLLERQRDALTTCGIDSITVVAGYKNEAISRDQFTVCLNPEFDSTNMVYTLFCAESSIDPSKDTLLIYGDCIYEDRVIKALLDDPSDLALTIDLNWRAYWNERLENPLEDAETLKLDALGNIIELGKKPESYDDVQGQYMGLIKIAAGLWPKISSLYHDLPKDLQFDGKDFNNMYMTSFLQYIINQGLPIKSVPVSGGWLEFDSVEDLDLYERLHKDGRLTPFYKA